tara:strand:+ start:1253 stop:1693 length:441 start_codon:yes stop_codon:yes gene_type:complete
VKSTNLAYWIGVVQTDGSFVRRKRKKNKTYDSIELGVGYPSLEMLKKFRNLSQRVFGVKGHSWQSKKKRSQTYGFGAKALIPLFNQLEIEFSDPPKPPKWIVDNNEFFGAYLAGVIDGDGSVVVKRQQYPQCLIRICSGSKAQKLQ